MRDPLLSEVQARLARYFNGFFPGIYHESKDVTKHIDGVLEAMDKRPGADYWVEVPSYLCDEPWFQANITQAGLELLYIGPRGTSVSYWRVRDPGAGAELRDRTVLLTVDVVPVDNASPPAYRYDIVKREIVH